MKSHYITFHIFIYRKVIIDCLLIFSCFTIYLSDGTSTGDGSHIGNCPASFSGYKCLSSGACNVCGNINSGTAEGCDIDSDKPVCDADKATTMIEDTVTDKEAKCVACKKSGNDSFLDYDKQAILQFLTTGVT